MFHTTMRFASAVLLAVLLGSPVAGQFRESPMGNSSDLLGPDSSVTVWSSATPYILGGAAVLTTVFLSHDQRISDELYAWRLRTRTVDKLSPIVTELGSGAAAIGILTSFGAYGYFVDDERAIRVGKIGLQSFIATGAVDLFLKLLAGRERPSVATRSGGFWAGPFGYYRQGSPKRGTASFASFPSGHTTTAFSMATTFTDMYDDTPWVGYLSYSLATTVAVSRITEHQHWASDVVVAAVVGIYGTKLVESFNAPSSHVSLLPRMDGEGCGLLLSVRL